MAEARAAEIAGHGGLGRRLHGEIVVRAPPGSLGLLVALPARLAADVPGDRPLGRRRTEGPPGRRPPDAEGPDDERRDGLTDGESLPGPRRVHVVPASATLADGGPAFHGTLVEALHASPLGRR